MKNASLILLCLILVFGCKKDKNEPVSYLITINVQNFVDISLYEPGSGIKEFKTNSLLHNVSRNETFSYESGKSITIVANCLPPNNDKEIELIITKKATGEVIFHEKKIDMSKHTFIVQ